MRTPCHIYYAPEEVVTTFSKVTLFPAFQAFQMPGNPGRRAYFVGASPLLVVSVPVLRAVCLLPFVGEGVVVNV